MIHQLQQQMTGLMERVEEAEGRNRRNNVRVIGLPERCEGDRPAEFMEEWFKTHITDEGLSSYFCIERAHRIPTGPPRPGTLPRPLIVRVLNYRDRDLLLKAAREKGTVLYENRKISLYPDYTVIVQKQRLSYQPIKQKLRKLQVNYALLFPARLKIIYDKKTHFFESPADVEEWLDVMGLDASQRTDPEATSQRSDRSLRSARRQAKRRPPLPKTVVPLLSQQRQEQSIARTIAETFHEVTERINIETEDDTQHSDSESSITLFPSITPQTADEIIGNS